MKIYRVDILQKDYSGNTLSLTSPCFENKSDAQEYLFSMFGGSSENNSFAELFIEGDFNNAVYIHRRFATVKELDVLSECPPEAPVAMELFEETP